MSYKPKVLVVVEDESTRQLFETVLNDVGASPRCTGDAERANEFLESEKFQGIFISWDTKEFDPSALTRHIRKSKEHRKVPVAMVTVQREAAVIAEGFKAGVTFFLNNPVDAKELRKLLGATFRAMLEERRQNKRVPVNVGVTCAWEEHRVTGQSVNISPSGLLLALKGGPAPKVGTAVALEFLLPQSERPMKLNGLIVRPVPGNQVGIVFTGLRADEQETLNNFVDRRLAVAGRA
jgi:CheY-like chemotaxis protein